ncbi:nuclear pore complex protein NUP98A isoform X1 [Medicago truncatula]|uniref:nuclear pore complex protein NUP98A isoform X1 n=1 Tax=Medicago truncatula TaxID=3880 RepID=UPI0019670E11|nr:nuclear pore complex protein NUP98A-like isoform X1 [Medicago truncatula]
MQLIYPQFHPFGHSSSASGSSQSVFGQQNNSSNSPFAPKPFGSPTPFGSIAVNSTSGSTSTGVFGAAQTPSRFSFGGSSMPAYGASSTPAFGSSMPAFGPSSTPVLGSSFFGQVPAFGGFGYTPTQISPFGCSIQPAFGSSIFGLTGPPAFGSTGTASGATGAPVFCVTSTPVYFVINTPVFFVTSTPAFGSTSTPAFDCTGGAFGMSSAPLFRGEGTFGASSNHAFGSSSTPAFEASSSPAFGASAFGQSSSAFGTNSTFGRTTSTYGGSHTPAPGFGNADIGQSGFGGQRGGSRVASYSATTEANCGRLEKLESISVMPVYKDKSHEELRWEDYQLGDKGGPLAFAPQPTGTGSWKLPGCLCSAAFPHSTVFCPSSSNLSNSTTPNSYPFVPNTSTFSSGFGTSAPAFSSSAFGLSTSAAAPSTFPSSTPLFGDNSSSQAFRPSASLFNTAARGTSAPFFTSSFRNTQPSQLFSSAAPTNAQSASDFGQNTAPIGQTAALSQSSLFSSPPSGLVGNIYSSGASLSCNDPTGFGQTAPSVSTPFQSAQPAQSSGTFSFSNFARTQPAGASSSGGTPGMFGQNNVGLRAIPQSSMVAQAAPITDPFGTLSAFGTNSPFGSTTSAFGGQSSAFGSQTPTQAFGSTGIGQSGFGGQRGGSRIASYSATVEADSGASGHTAKLESISAMPVYKDKSHEELRWEDYHLGDKGSSAFGQKPAFGGFGSNPTQTSPFGSATQPSQPAFGSNTQQSQPVFGSSILTPFGASSQPEFGSTCTPAFGATSTPASAFGAPNSCMIQ